MSQTTLLNMIFIVNVTFDSYITCKRYTRFLKVLFFVEELIIELL